MPGALWLLEKHTNIGFQPEKGVSIKTATAQAGEIRKLPHSACELIGSKNLLGPGPPLFRVNLTINDRNTGVGISTNSVLL